MKDIAKYVICLVLLAFFTSPAICADKVITLNSAWELYTQKKYKDSASAFEYLIKSQRPSPKLYYYAAHANFSANRKARSRQLCRYIVTKFPSSKHKSNCLKMFPELASLVQPKEATPEEVVVVKTDEKGATTSSKKKTIKKKFMVATNMKRGERPFTAQSIAKDGANGIDQNINPNCWFEASMAALAELPRGQRLLANMIRYGDSNSYIVRFPGDGVEYKITKKELKRRGINDRALWASLIECAQVMKFPNNRGAEGPSGQESRLAVGLRCITGCRAQILHPGSASIQQLSSFIDGAVSSKNPIVCGTYSDRTLSKYPKLVFGAHAYTIIGFEPSSKLITIRNPHGARSRKYFLGNDPQHRKFEQLGDGKFKMHLALFQKYFNQVCRSNI